MTDNHRKAGKGERTMLLSLLLSAPGPLVTGLAVLSSRSATQIADFLRRDMELIALVAAYVIYRKLQRMEDPSPAARQRLERAANLFAGGAMAVSGIAMLLMAARQLTAYDPSGNVTPGLVIAILGLVSNGLFWMRYRSLAAARHDAVLAAQQALYRAKTCVDLCVTIALATVAVAPLHPATRYVDIVGSAIVACYLLWNGVKMVLAAPRFGTMPNA